MCPMLTSKRSKRLIYPSSVEILHIKYHVSVTKRPIYKFKQNLEYNVNISHKKKSWSEHYIIVFFYLKIFFTSWLSNIPRIALLMRYTLPHCTSTSTSASNICALVCYDYRSKKINRLPWISFNILSSSKTKQILINGLYFIVLWLSANNDQQLI